MKIKYKAQDNCWRRLAKTPTAKIIQSKRSMRKILSILFLLGIVISVKAQDNRIPDDTLMWRANRPLGFNDFTGEPIESSNLMGEAFCLILTAYDKPADSDWYKISVVAVFDRTNSWISHRAKPDEILLFQVTFNVFEVYARQLRRDLQQITTGASTQYLFQRKYAAALPLLTHTCNELKRDTRMGSDRGKLSEWNQKINKELKELEQYK